MAYGGSESVVIDPATLDAGDSQYLYIKPAPNSYFYWEPEKRTYGAGGIGSNPGGVESTGIMTGAFTDGGVFIGAVQDPTDINSPAAVFFITAEGE